MVESTMPTTVEVGDADQKSASPFLMSGIAIWGAARATHLFGKVQKLA